MRASFGSLPILAQLVAVAVQSRHLPAAADEQIDTTSFMQLSAESRQPSLVGGREHVEAHWEEAQKEQSEAEKQAAAIEKVKEHHARMEQLRKYKVAVDQMIHEETAATQKDKRSAGIPSGVVEPPVVNLANDGFAVRADGQQTLLQIPRALPDTKLLKLRVDAEFGRLGAERCGGAFMKSLTFFGNWTEKVGLVDLKPGSDQAGTPMLINTRPNFRGSSVSLEFGGVTFRVEKQYGGRDGQPKSYLDVHVLGLRHHHDVGGILGHDDHTQAELPSAGCLPAQDPSTNASTAMIETGSAAAAGSRAVVVD